MAWNLPDPIPMHREPIYSPRVDLVEKYPDAARCRAVPGAEYRLHDPEAGRGERDRQGVPDRAASGRLVEYEGGGEETRSNKWLAELQQDAFVEINPADASDRGIKDGQWVWVLGAADTKPRLKVKALVTERVGKGVAWMPFHFAGWFQGVDQRSKYPKGADPIVLGESVNTAMTYGYDPVTGMQETKCSLCQIRAA